MTRVIAVANQKGGVGKTTTAVNLSAYLGATGAGRILLVDVDPQANATSWLTGTAERPERSVYDVLLGDARLPDVIVETRERALALAPSSPSLAGAQVELVDAPDRERRLRAALELVNGAYDLIIIDCPPSLGLLTVNALVAADAVLVPVQCEYLALEGLGQLIQVISAVREQLNAHLELLGVLLTMHDGRTNLSTQVIDEVRRHFPAETFDNVVPRSVRLSEAPSYGQSILSYDASSRGALAYAGVAEEVIRRGYGP
jgi:chromosome partitioning protein